MREIIRRAIIAAAIVAAAAIVFAVLYYGVFPKVSYRKLVMAVTSEGSITGGEIVRGGHELELTDKQCLAVATWLAEYRSSNGGVSHTDERGGYELRLHFGDREGHSEVLHVEENAIVFRGIMGNYRIQVNNNELYDMISDLLNY